MYLYCVVLPECQSSRFVNGDFGFPFDDEQLVSVSDGIWYTSAFGPRESPTEGASSYHHGIDLGALEGTEIHAVHDGVVTAAGDGWGESCNALNIAHTDGQTYSRYLHCSRILVTTGQSVSKGEVIALVGSIGPSTGPHLHLEISSGNSEASDSSTDPLSFFPKFCIPLGEKIVPA